MLLYRAIITAAALSASATTAQTILWEYKSWSSIACYPATPAPLIDPLSLPPSGMTVEKCLDAVESTGHIYGGVLNGTLCFAGNVIRQESPLPPSACKVPCSGKPSEICGGPDGVLIYQTDGFITPTPWSSLDGYNSLGCYGPGPTGEILTHEVVDAAPTSTIKSIDCVQACAQLDFKLVGLRRGYQCFCGNALLNNPIRQSDSGFSVCYIGCEGSVFEQCGGWDAVTIYQHGTDPITSGPGQTIQNYNDWSLLDCYSDSVASRSLSNLVPFPKEDMTVEQCLDACNAQGFHLAGVEYGQECYCGNVIQPPGAVAPSGCDAMQCVGNANQFCGGPDRLLVYQHA